MTQIKNVVRLAVTTTALLAGGILFAGQSLVLTPSGSTLSAVDPPYPSSQPYRVELQLHNLVRPPAGVYGQKLFWLSGIGLMAAVFPDGSINFGDYRDNVAGGSPCVILTNSYADMLIRFQRDVAQKRITCELWKVDGSGYTSQVQPMTSANNYPGQDGNIGLGIASDLGFLRIATTVLPLGSRPPTTADAGDWSEWKFDGNLNDSSGHGHGLLGVPSFTSTPDQVPVALPKTMGAPSWSNWVSLRAGFPAQLDGTSSYSLADASSSVSFAWQQLSGPSTVSWQNRNVATPTITGLVFGTYNFALRVTDAAGHSNISILQTGAVATDDNGVVINADPNVHKIFGPMIAFGRNPWGYADERALAATTLRAAAYHAQGLDNPTWATPQPGTVSYNYAGANGPYTGNTSAPIPDSAATTISVADASRLDLTTFPTHILLGAGYGQKEDVRICAASATSGPATLTVCYDGRGQALPGGESYRTNAKAWPTNTPTWQMKVKGQGTNFLTNICPGGIGPGGGPLLYNTGKITLKHGSTAAVGTGTVWGSSANMNPGTTIVRVEATHRGSPFVFYAYATQIADAQHLTLSRVYPSDADDGTYSYSMFAGDNRYITLHYTRTVNGSDAQAFNYIAGCESATEMYLYESHDLSRLANGPQSAQQYSYLDGLGYASAYGPNFYGEDLAHRAFYYRSGLTSALTAARVMGDNFARSPVLAGGDIGGFPLLVGGGVIGGFASAVLDTADPNHAKWSDLRGYANWGSIGSLGCNAADTRDTAYLSSFVAIAAAFDPDPSQSAVWNAQLRSIYNRELNCKQPDNSWAHGNGWSADFGPLTVTSGSAVVRRTATSLDGSASAATTLPPGMCHGISSGWVNVTKGSAVARPSGALVPGNQIFISATLGGSAHPFSLQFQINADGSATLAELWTGDSGTFPYVIESDDSQATIAVSNDDPQLAKEWACTWNTSDQITLDRPWDGPTESNAYLAIRVVAGYGQQPFMMGIKTTELAFASLNPDSATSANFKRLAISAAQWIHDTGYDKASQGLRYGSVYQLCEPSGTPTPLTAFTARTPGCDYGLDTSSIRASRVLTAEVSQAIRVLYESNPTPANKAWGDTAYGSIWGNSTFANGNVYTDDNYVRDENGNTSLGNYKWTGFFFGMGLAHQWPAVRAGGLAPPQFRTVKVNLDATDSSSADVIVTAPSGATTTYLCGPLSACKVQVDDRQGAHSVKIQYHGRQEVLVESTPRLLPAPQSFGAGGGA